MPISFNQPEPVNAASAYEVGAFPIRMQAREQLAREQAAAGASGAQANETNFRSRAAAGGLLQGQQQFEEGQRQQREEFQAGLTQQTARDVFQAQHEQAMQAQRAQLGVWANSQDLSNQEQVTYQRLQQSLAAWNDRKRAGGLDDEDYYNGIAQLRTGIDPLKMKIERARAMEDQSRAQQLQQQANHQAAATKAFEASMAQGGPPMAVDPAVQQQIGQEVAQEIQQKAAASGIPPQAIDPQAIQREVLNRARQRGIPVWVMHKPGEWVQEKSDKGGQPAGREGRLDEANYLKAYADVEKTVQHAIIENMKLPPDLRDKQMVWANESQLIADKLGGRGMAPDVESHRTAIEGGRPGAGGNNPAQNNAPPPGTNQNPGAPPAPQPPFEPSKPQTDEQRVAVTGIQALREKTAELGPRDNPLRKRYEAEADRAMSLLSKYGSEPAMKAGSPAEWAEYERVMNSLANMRPPRPPEAVTRRPGRAEQDVGRAYGIRR